MGRGRIVVASGTGTDGDGRDALSREALRQVERDTQSIAGSPLQRAGRRLGDHFSGADAPAGAEDGAPDPIEVWGRRIGRALSVVLAGALIWWLGVQLGRF